MKGVLPAKQGFTTDTEAQKNAFQERFFSS